MEKSHRSLNSKFHELKAYSSDLGSQNRADKLESRRFIENSKIISATKILQKEELLLKSFLLNIKHVKSDNKDRFRKKSKKKKKKIKAKHKTQHLIMKNSEEDIKKNNYITGQDQHYFSDRNINRPYRGIKSKCASDMNVVRPNQNPLLSNSINNIYLSSSHKSEMSSMNKGDSVVLINKLCNLFPSEEYSNEKRSLTNNHMHLNAYYKGLTKKSSINSSNFSLNHTEDAGVKRINVGRMSDISSNLNCSDMSSSKESFKNIEKLNKFTKISEREDEDEFKEKDDSVAYIMNGSNGGQSSRKNIKNENNSQSQTKSQSNKKNTVNKTIKSFNNVCDSLSDEEILIIKDSSYNYTIHPDSILRFIWDRLSLIPLIYSIFITPFFLAFYYYESGYPFYTEMFIDLFFAIDIILTFFTSYYEDNDKIVTNLYIIFKNYIKSWLFIDLLSLFPSIFILINSGYINVNDEFFSKKVNSIKIYNLAKMYFRIKWMRILRITRAIRVQKSNNKLGKLVESNFINYLSALIILVHLASCFWCYLGNLQSIVYLEQSWLDKYSVIELGHIEILVTSYYFVLTTIFTIGYGDITPTTKIERLYVMFLMMIGSMIWSFVLTSLSHVFSHKVEKKLELEYRMRVLEEINKEFKLPQPIFDRYRKFIYYGFHKYNKDQLLLVDSLPSNLRNTLYLNMYGRHIHKLKFFHNQCYDFITTVLPKLKSACYLRNELVISIGSIIEGVYMVYKGILGVHLGSMYENIEIAKIYNSYHIGEILMYSHSQSPYDIKVKTHKSDLLILMKNDFANLYFPFAEAIDQILQKSEALHYEIEEKKRMAMDHYRLHGTMKGYSFKPKEEKPQFNNQNESEDKSDYPLERENIQINENLGTPLHNSSKKQPDSTPTPFNKPNALDVYQLQGTIKNIQKSRSHSMSVTASQPINNQRDLSPNLNKKFEKYFNIRSLQSLNSFQSPSIGNTNKVRNNSFQNNIHPDVFNFNHNAIANVDQTRNRRLSFLEDINSKIGNHAIMYKNKEIIGEYFKDVLTMEKSVFTKLDNLEIKLKKHCK